MTINANKQLVVQIAIIIIFFILISSCAVFTPYILEAPKSIREAAWTEAQRYIGMEYEWGGEDFPFKGIDCSGLVINVYYTVTINTYYRLPFIDASVKDIYERYTLVLDNPEKGDLIFLCEADNDEITHIAILEKIENGDIFFIDSTYQEEPYINGVTYRSYNEDNPKIKSFGRILLQKYR